MNRKLTLCWVAAMLCCSAGAAAAQYSQQAEPLGPEVAVSSPVRFPLLLSANYGELRGNHFHSGIDIKTQGVIGKPIYAIADGTVARIAVSPSGFGKALYMDHPDGTTSVYGHLERFTDEIEDYIHEIQYARRSFAVDVTPPVGMFHYQRGEQIAVSGNRGSSGGPHLHLEVRETASQRPLNILARGILEVNDSIPPRPVVLYYIEIDTVQGVPVHTMRQKRTVRRDAATGVYMIQDTSALRISRNGYFAVEAAEKKNGTANPMGIYTFDVLYDGVEAFSMEVDRVPFDVGRYCYAAALYPQSRKTRNGVYKLYRGPHNRLPLYGRGSNGVLTLADRETHRVEVVMYDDCGNSSTLVVPVVWGLQPRKERPQGIPVKWSENFRYDEGGLSLTIPQKALFESILLDLSTKTRPSYAYSPLYVVHTADVPVYGSITVQIDASELPVHLRDKALVGSVSANGHRSSAGGAWKEGKVTTKTRSFGTFYIAVDTVAPRITPKFKDNDDFSSRRSMSVKISDDFSGVASYSATIDGEWALFEYDPKSATLTHYFDDTRWDRGVVHTLKLTVVDGKGNRTTETIRYKR